MGRRIRHVQLDLVHIDVTYIRTQSPSIAKLLYSSIAWNHNTKELIFLDLSPGFLAPGKSRTNVVEAGDHNSIYNRYKSRLYCKEGSVNPTFTLLKDVLPLMSWPSMY